MLQQLTQQLVSACDDSDDLTKELLVWTLHAMLMGFLECNAVRCGLVWGHTSLHLPVMRSLWCCLSALSDLAMSLAVLCCAPHTAGP